jgi:hypothetical protein
MPAPRGNGVASDLNAFGSPEPMRREERDAPKGTWARITDETIKTSESELNTLIQAAVEKIARTRDLIAKLDELLAKRL